MKVGETLKGALWNVMSMVHKTEKIMEHIVDRDPDIVFLTELTFSDMADFREQSRDSNGKNIWI